MRRAFTAAATALAAAACGPVATGGGGCSIVGAPGPLPGEISEASGIALSRVHPGVWWTHNDDGGRLYAIDPAGRMLATFRVGARVRDWEDLDVGPCPAHVSCVYIADTGDNYEERTDVAILRAAEPDPSQPGTLDPERFPIRLPDGPRDIEAVAVLDGERILFVTKGRNHGIAVYRYPGPLRPERVTLEWVQDLSEGPAILPRMVTGASAMPGADVVAIRTYQALRFYRLDGDTLAEVDGSLVNLRPVGEIQGEGVGLGQDGEVVLVSESGPAGAPGGYATLRCRVDVD